MGRESRARVHSVIDGKSKKKLHRSKLQVNCLHMLSLRRLLMVGTSDGAINACV